MATACSEAQTCGSHIARLDSACGSLYMYDITALEVLVSKLPQIEPALSTPEPVLFEGFSGESWAHYAKKKAKIATSVCKTNGLLRTQLVELKDKLSQLGFSCSGEDGMECSDEDPLVTCDP